MSLLAHNLFVIIDKGKGHTFDIVPLSEGITAEALRNGTHCRGMLRVHLHTRAFIHELSEPYLPLPFQPKLSSFIDAGGMESGL